MGGRRRWGVAAATVGDQVSLSLKDSDLESVLCFSQMNEGARDSTSRANLLLQRRIN